MAKLKKITQACDYHRFIDEAGDMTFFGKGKSCVLGQTGVSKVFILGMTAYKEPLFQAREKIIEFCQTTANDPYFNTMPSVAKRINQGGFYLHAKDDPAELRYKFLTFMVSELDFSSQAIVGRKDLDRFVRKHHSREREFYADLLSHLLKDKANYPKLVVNIAQRGSCTQGKNLSDALQQTHARYHSQKGGKYKAAIKFNVQPYDKEPLLTVIDYSLWAIQRVFQRGEDRHYQLIKDKISLVFDLYDVAKAGKENCWGNCYTPKNPLSRENKID